MAQTDQLTRWRRLVHALLAVIAAANAGCLLAAAGVAGGTAAGYVYCKGKLCDAYTANFDDVWAAAHSALVDLGMPVVQEERGPLKGFLRTQLADGERVRIHFKVIPSKIPVEGTLTQVTIRVGTFGDHPASVRILSQISAHLAPAPLPPPTPPPLPAPVTLQPPAPVPAQPVEPPTQAK
jgi:hypothetical protein